MVEVYLNILSGMMDVYVLIIFNNMNIVMKFFIFFIIILMILIMVFSFYGMNVKLLFMNILMVWMLMFGFVFGIVGVFVIVFWWRKFF